MVVPESPLRKVLATLEHSCLPQRAGESGGPHPVNASSPPVPAPVGSTNPDRLGGLPVIHPDSFSIISDMPGGGKPEKAKVKAGVLDRNIGTASTKLFASYVVVVVGTVSMANSMSR